MSNAYTYEYSEQSKLYLSTCHADIRNVFNTVIRFRDCTIIEGYRDEARQNEAFRTGRSDLKWPEGNHNKEPATAVDAAPYFADRSPHIDWNDREAFIYFAGFVLGVAASKGIKLRFGGNWSMTGRITSGDLVHYETFN